MARTGKHQSSAARPGRRGAGEVGRNTTRQRARELDSLNALGRKVGLSPSLGEAMKFAVREVKKLLAPDVVMLHLREGDSLVRKEMRPMRPKFRAVGDGPHRVGQCLCGLAARGGPVYSVDIHRDVRCTLPECKAAGLRSFAAVPVGIGGQVLGVLSVGSLGERDFREHGAFLEALAGQLAIGLHNAMLREELQRHAEELEGEVARRGQAERGLTEANATLERRVQERTALAEKRAAQLRALAANLVHAEQWERQRLARVLHEEVQQLLAAVKYRQQMLGDLAKGRAVRRLVAQSGRLLEKAIKASRSLTVELCPPVLQTLGLAAALEWLGRHMKEAHGLDVAVKASARAEPADEALRVFLFQAVRELLFNVVKHAGTDGAAVRMGRRGDRTLVEVADGGVGFDPGEPRARPEHISFGLFSIGERIGLLGGRMEVHSAAGKGCKVTLIVPSGRG